MPADLLSLYIDLEEGQRADLEIASRAAIAFAETVREAAAFVDPLCDVRLEFIDTTEGSLSLNTKIRFITASGPKEITLYALIIICSAWIGSQALTFVAGKEIAAAYEHFFGADEASLSDKDKQDIADRVLNAIKAGAGERQAQRIYAELDKDPAVKGVGVSPRPGVRPEAIVPRSQFRKRSGVVIVEEPEIKVRRRTETRKVVLVSPVLTPDRKRRWKFRIDRHEFGAPIKDEYFLDAVFSGKHPILMKGNIEMTVRLETNEKFEKGVWHETDHTVWQVIGVPGQYQGPQTSLPLDDAPKRKRQPKDSK